MHNIVDKETKMIKSPLKFSLILNIFQEVPNLVFQVPQNRNASINFDQPRFF